MAEIKCLTCGDSGDVHTIDGQWRGECTACDAAEIIRMRVEIERLRADLSRERAAHEETRLARNRARLDGIAEARKNLPPEIERLKLEAAGYRLLRRGQHWSVIDGVGQTLRGEELDAAVVAVKGKT